MSVISNIEVKDRVGLYFKFDDDESHLIATAPEDPGTFEFKLKYIKPQKPSEDIGSLIEKHPDKIDQIRLDLLEVISLKFGAEDLSLCAFVAIKEG